MNKIITALLLVSTLNALISPTYAGDDKAKNYSNINTTNAPNIRSNQNYRDLNRNSGEMSMIELQSVVSNRANAVQFTTGMMKSINEGQKTINGNIGR